MVGNGREIVGAYPTYVLRSGAFLAGTFFFLKSAPLYSMGKHKVYARIS